MRDAARTAKMLGVEHLELDARDQFIQKVIDPFAEAYAKGMTPNPCILCNRHIKFPLLLKEADRLGAGLISTGHYARAEGGRLMRAFDQGKDQSYVLYCLGREALARLVLPLGGLTKPEVRDIAKKLGLPVFTRPESQEICFVAERSYRDFLGAFTPDSHKPGPVLGEDGQRIGTHRGVHAYTLGQRKGLGVQSLTPLFVTAIDAARNEIHVGPRKAAERRRIKVDEINWISSAEAGEFRSGVKVRSTMPPAPAVVRVVSRYEAEAVFDEPVWAPAPGQSAVFYDGDTVLGGGIIVSSDIR